MENLTLQPETAAWLERERGIPSEIAARFGVVTTRKGYPAFVYQRASGFQYLKARVPRPDGEKTFMRFPSGGKSSLFLEQLIETDPDLSSPLVITEGEIDALSCCTAALSNVVSVPDGAQRKDIGQEDIDPNRDTSFSWLWTPEGKLKPHIDQFTRIVLAVDGDDKGYVLREELAVRLGRGRCYWVQWPEGVKDANDMLLQHGDEALRQLILAAKPLVVHSTVLLRDMPSREDGVLYESGFSGLDDVLGLNFTTPALVVVTGAPGSGKSEWTTVLCAQLFHRHGLKSAILQFEDRASRIITTLSNYAFLRVHPENRSKARDWALDNFRVIQPAIEEEVDFTLQWLKQTLYEVRTQHDCRVVMVDPWNELEHIWQRGQTQADYITEALRQLRKLTRQLDLILIIVTHPSVGAVRNLDIVDADLYMAAGSGSWNGKADLGFIIHRPKMDEPFVYVKLAKSKDHMLWGRPGIVRYEFLPSGSNFKFIQMGVAPT